MADLRAKTALFQSTQDKGVFFVFAHFEKKICEILKFGKNLELEIIDYIFRKIIMINEVQILESPNEYYQKQV